MPWWERETFEEPLLKLIFDAVRMSGGRGPVPGYVYSHGLEHGIPHPEQALEKLAPELIHLESPPSPTANIGLKVLGALKCEPQAREVITALSPLSGPSLIGSVERST